jgi:hypothetical protein
MREKRPLTLDEVPADLVAEIAPARSYRCAASDAVLIPVSKVRGPASAMRTI